mmetsp:Transcript_659/g.1533  ORF Transcript_659/g.1533 Transcript_659/m.1533 type:complete len:282 (-) Transcript_659:347-1192(-)
MLHNDLAPLIEHPTLSVHLEKLPRLQLHLHPARLRHDADTAATRDGATARQHLVRHRHAHHLGGAAKCPDLEPTIVRSDALKSWPVCEQRHTGAVGVQVRERELPGLFRDAERLRAPIQVHLQGSRPIVTGPVQGLACAPTTPERRVEAVAAYASVDLAAWPGATGLEATLADAMLPSLPHPLRYHRVHADGEVILKITHVLQVLRSQCWGQQRFRPQGHLPLVQLHGVGAEGAAKALFELAHLRQRRSEAKRSRQVVTGAQGGYSYRRQCPPLELIAHPL